MDITITRITDDTELFCHYQGQTQPQDCYVELECETGQLRATYNGEIGNAVPFSVWHQKVLRWTIPALTAETANDLLNEIKPHAQIIVDGYDTKWDGNNYVGRYTEDATEAIQTVEQMCEGTEGDLMVWDAGDWLQAVSSDELGITAKTTDKELEAKAADLLAEAHGEDVHILTSLDDYLEELRNDLREEVA